MSASQAAPPASSDESRLRGPSLPPVEAPTGTFILQLFLIPLLIVSIVVLLWLLFSWIAHMGRDNAGELAKAIERGDQSSWQRAYELADLLRSSDPKFEPLRRDGTVAKKLADFLIRDLAEPVTRSKDDQPRVMRRMYLCRTLGSFKVQDGLPALLVAAKQERNPVEVEVRFSALEAIATLADNCGPELLQDNLEVLGVLVAASNETDDTAPPPTPNDDGTPTFYRPHAELRAVAAYGLGVIGGEQATQRLRGLLHDTYPNTRYNAATGLARQGDVEAIRVLREMLDPDNQPAIRDESNPIDQARKRTTVLLNGIKASLLLAETNPTADISRLKESLRNLSTSDLTSVTVDRSKIKEAAAEALRRIEKKS